MLGDFQPAFASDDYLVQLPAAQQGLGALVLPRVGRRLWQPGNLVELQPADMPARQTELHLVTTRSAMQVPRVRAVADLLVAELQAD